MHVLIQSVDAFLCCSTILKTVESWSVPTFDCMLKFLLCFSPVQTLNTSGNSHLYMLRVFNYAKLMHNSKQIQHLFHSSQPHSKIKSEQKHHLFC